MGGGLQAAGEGMGCGCGWVCFLGWDGLCLFYFAWDFNRNGFSLRSPDLGDSFGAFSGRILAVLFLWCWWGCVLPFGGVCLAGSARVACWGSVVSVTLPATAGG